MRPTVEVTQRLIYKMRAAAPGLNIRWLWAWKTRRYCGTSLRSVTATRIRRQQQKEPCPQCHMRNVLWRQRSRRVKSNVVCCLWCCSHGVRHPSLLIRVWLPRVHMANSSLSSEHHYCSILDVPLQTLDTYFPLCLESVIWKMQTYVLKASPLHLPSCFICHRTYWHLR